ncbi:MAG: FKBP-type peptidyl-prolyl cis-trans isomerase [Breznakibacter sp.]
MANHITPIHPPLKNHLGRLAWTISLLCLPLMVGCQQPEQPRRTVTQEDLIEANRNLVGRDANAIKAYLAEHKLRYTETQTGLWYSISDQGVGNYAKKGQVITLKYTVTLLDGTPCYSSKKTGPKKFLIGQGGVESGLEEAVLMLRKKAKAKFILPPHLAYGLIGDNDQVPARATLIYDVEVVDLE